MTLHDFIERVEATDRSLELYTPKPEPKLLERFERANVTVQHRSLPSVSDDGFLVVYENNAFQASIGIAAVREFLDPPVADPWDERFIGADYRRLLEVLAQTPGERLSRRQLLATARDIEHCAWQSGNGVLRVGFQRLTAFEDQLAVYDRLARETNLEVHVYGSDDWRSPVGISPTVHAEEATEIGEYWFLVYDSTDEQYGSYALLANERDPGEYAGFWTFDRELVAEMNDYLRETYG